MDVDAPRGPLRFFDELEDPRMDRTKLHSLDGILFITLCAALAGADSWTEVEVYGNGEAGLAPNDPAPSPRHSVA